jgi:HD-GYP domain-containing protein (c-di-GMP phosphodiesterase class II)
MNNTRKSPLFLVAEQTCDSLRCAVAEAGWTCLTTEDMADVDVYQVALVQIKVTDDADELRRRYPQALLVCLENNATAPSQKAAADFNLDPDLHTALLPQILSHAEKYWRKNCKVTELAHDLGLRRQRMHQLSQISLALTAQMSQQELLHTILSEACRIARCEGGSLFLIEQQTDQDPCLVFKLAQNVKVDFPFVETRLPLTAESIAGHVATTGDELNIRDVYRLPEDLPYRFNRSFDERMAYRTRSILAIPMRDHREQVVGVLQFINRTHFTTGQVISFDEEIAEVLRAIASQAAVSIQKNALLEDINQLFESFVQASVKTIEQRDPSTSGHSFRVAETTVALLEALPKSGVSDYRDLQLAPEHIREVRYAALLHDFGKVGVPEAILVKANKLSDERLEVVRYRFEIQKERLRRRAVEQELELLHHAGADLEVARRRVHRQLEKQLAVLDQYFEWVERANNPNVLDAGDYGHLAEIRDHAFRELDGTVGGVINDADVLALSVRKGSLTPDERRAIQSHVVFTKDFLSTLPWPPELAKVPEIAGAHHERQDGSGYPLGLVGEQIPLASRVMAVCDVYDALTAMDRPYKPAMSCDTAFAILQDEARRGLLDVDLVSIFIDSESYLTAKAV